MRSNAWHVVRTLTAALVAVAFALLPLMGDASMSSKHHNVTHTAACAGDFQSKMSISHHSVMSDSGQKGDCGRIPVQKTNCCLGTFCPSVQMVELTSIDLPTPQMTNGVRQAISSATGYGLQPAPTPRPPRQFI
ncbi:MAG: hypothetical protein E6Q98_01410 [Rhodospirillaceae bacterium]|nr:MAG: hypothetical protein E6Q98_01410 [Rhodospirillaceae bacterium]